MGRLEQQLVISNVRKVQTSRVSNVERIPINLIIHLNNTGLCTMLKQCTFIMCPANAFAHVCYISRKHTRVTMHCVRPISTYKQEITLTSLSGLFVSCVGGSRVSILCVCQTIILQTCYDCRATVASS